MKRYLGVVLALVFVVASIVVAYRNFKTKDAEAQRDANAARIKIEYLERVGWIRSNPDEKSYKDEVETFFRWYFGQVQEHLNRFGGNRNFDGYLAELEKRKDPQAAEKKAIYDYVKNVFDKMREGKYQPVWSASDKGLRLDVLSTEPVTSGGEPKIRYQVVLWGPQRELREDGKVRKMATSASWSIMWKMFDEKGKLISEMTAQGDPSNKVDWPERFIPEFPPQMYLGHYDVDLVPAEVKNMEITFTVASRSSTGGDQNAQFLWKLEPPAEWKLRPGEQWKGAQESVRPEDEIDPSKRAQR